MHYATVQQSVPLVDDGPNSFGQGYDTIGDRQSTALHTLCHSIWKRTFAPMLGVNIFVGHQSAQVKDHGCSKASLQSQRNRRGNMAARVDQLDPVTANELLCQAHAVGDVVHGGRQRRLLMIA